ncbi:hypothetical protein DFP72DRAFT_923187 [Ephemerocybe angulata]|uniref:Uncharacterized protein n=1 Tax=Ephemerocybe angulata TaxID=980116 RepID=A0A8H6LY40_9AGAR|nr:hypothetical protein DFP72DRAFT_923187 [Tulosesus angulatus]
MLLEDAVSSLRSKAAFAFTTSIPTSSSQSTMATAIHPSGPIALPDDTKRDAQYYTPTEETFPTKNNPFSDQHSIGPPPVFKSDGENSMYTYENGHSHHAANAFITSTSPSIRSQSIVAADVQYPAQPPVYYDPETEGVQAAAERLAQALEVEAGRQTDRRPREALMRKARKVRKKAGKMKAKMDRKSGGDKSIVKNVGVGLLMFVTVPLWATGAAMEATGTILKATGMVLKGAGHGFKKMHTATMEKLDVKL